MTDETNNRRPVEIDDLYRIRLVSDPQVSPDGTQVAFTLTRLRTAKDDYASNIWLVPVDGSAEPRRFTASEARDTAPRWSPDGKEIAFISTRAGKPQIWVIPTDGGEARRLTRVKHGVQEVEWSSDGKWLAFTAKVEADSHVGSRPAEAQEDSQPDDSENRAPGEGGEEGLALPQARGTGEWEDDDDDRDPDSEKDKAPARIIERVHYKADGSGYLDHRAHLFVMPARGGAPVQVTSDDWDVSAPRWSPDGPRLAYLTNKEDDRDYRNIQDIFVADIGPAGTPLDTVQVTHHNLAVRGYDWLPDGSGFCLLGHQRLDEAAFGSNSQVWVVRFDGEPVCLTAGWDRSASAELLTDLRSGVGPLRPRFGPDGREVYFMGLWGGSVRLFSVPLSGGEVREIVGGDRMLLNFSIGHKGVAYGSTTATHPGDIYYRPFGDSEERQLTNVNRDLLGLVDAYESHEFTTVQEDGTHVQGWYILPPGFVAGKKYPTLLQIHGGPHSAYGSAYFHEFQVLAARGYVVIYTNPRGSQGYGQAFADAISDDWGGVDYDDLMACLDHVIGLGFVDEEKLGVGGGSYGGYMSAWIVGHTNRFKAAVASRLVSNLYSAWGNGDFTWLLWNWEMHGMPQERTDLYIERSPVQHARNINTPLLITHAEDDLRCNLEQAEQMYMALKVQKKPVKMVLFPSGGHDVSRTGKPSIRVERLKQIAEWFDSYLLNRD